jgi:hypothetical protein
MTDGDSRAGRVRTYVPLCTCFCGTVRTYMFAVRTHTHPTPHTHNPQPTATPRQRGRKTKKTEILGTKRRKKSYLFFSNFRVLVCCLQLSVVCCVLCVVCDRSGGVHCTLNCSSLTKSHRHLDQGKEGYLLYGLRKEPSCKAPHIHCYGIRHKKYGTSSYRRLCCESECEWTSIFNHDIANDDFVERIKAHQLHHHL